MPDADAIDSKCFAPPVDTGGPTEAKCGNDAVSLVRKPGGHRTYICEDHAEQVKRFDDDVFGPPYDPPIVVECVRCHKLTPDDRANWERICEECEDDS